MNTVFSESALSVVNIDPSDQSQSGVYTCRARNSLGEANRSTAVLVTGESLLHQFNVRKIAHAVFFLLITGKGSDHLYLAESSIHV